jgi:circadian clock protein KaiC
MSAGKEPVLARCDTGTSGLNHILGGGFPPNALYLVQGDPGVGKTTLALQFLMAGARAGESCLYITFSETSAELFAVAHSHGWSLDGINILELSDFALQLTAEAESTLFDPADMEIQDVTKSSLLKWSGSNRRGSFSILSQSCDYFRKAPFDIGVRF